VKFQAMPVAQAIGVSGATAASAVTHSVPMMARESIAVALSFLAFFVAFFSPVLFDFRLLAVGDATIQYLPMLLSPASLWNSYQYAGHPAFADPQSLIFSPLRFLGGDYNAAVVSVYVLAATSAYCLVRHLTGLRMAGALAGIVYGSAGAIMAHLGHLTIIYSAAWTPLIVWAVAVSKERASIVAMMAGAVAIGLSILGGHPQIFVYGLMVSGAYALYIVASAPAPHRRELTLRYAVLFGAGLAISCIQLMPLAEAGARSVREGYSFEAFTSFSLSPHELLLFVFPRMMGGIGMGYFGRWGVTELTTYCGISTIMLAIAAFTARRREREIWFWLAVLLLAVAYALGPWTPLSRIAYHLPGLGRFRAPARTAFVSTLALAVMAGFGYRALVERRLRGVRRARMWGRIFAFFAFAVLFLYLLYPRLVPRASGYGVHLPDMYANPGVLVAFASIALSAACIAVLAHKDSRVAACALALVLAVDLASFGWFAEWRYGASKTILSTDKRWQDFAAEVKDSARRVLFVNGINSKAVPVIPNANLVYRLPSASAYGPLILKNYADAMGMNVLGAVDSFDLLKERLQLAGAAWLIGGDEIERPLRIGGDCTSAQPRGRVKLRFPSPVRATQLEIVSNLACSTQLEQGTAVVRIDVRDTSGHHENRYLVAGKDTAEWAIDRPDVAATIRHRRPATFETFLAAGFNGEWFGTNVDLGNTVPPSDVTELTFDWLVSPGPAMAVRSIDLVDSRTGSRRRVSFDDLLWGDLDAAEDRSLPGNTWVRRVRGVRTQAWIVGDTLPVSDAQAVEVIRRGRLPDGGVFDPYATALVSNQDGDGRQGTGVLNAEARVLQWEDGLVRIDVQSSRNAFLVVAQTFYPGWTATVDGVATPIEQTNLAFQGLSVPAGRHTVVMSFMPRSLLLGFAFAFLGVAGLVAYLWVMRRSGRMRKPAKRGLVLASR
jgi:hypothetical protein